MIELQLTATLYMTGLIWFVQLAHYLEKSHSTLPQTISKPRVET
jgi:hypothetical protein